MLHRSGGYFSPTYTQASFHTAFAKVGLSGDYGGSYYLQHLIGYGRALELYYTGERVDAETALALGIANHVVPFDQFMAEAMDYCGRLAAGPTVAVRRPDWRAVFRPTPQRPR